VALWVFFIAIIVGRSLLSIIQAEIYDVVHLHFRFVASIFNLSHTPTSILVSSCYWTSKCGVAALEHCYYVG